MATPTSLSAFLLQSINALNPDTAKNPQTVLDYTTETKNQDLPVNMFNVQEAQRTFTGEFHNNTSSTTSYNKLAVSAGISGNYGLYSGSVQAAYEEETFTSATSFLATAITVINMGTISYNGSRDSISSFLKPELVNKLNSVGSVKDAKDFVDNYGTHVITGINLGGAIYTTIRIDNQSEATKQNISAELNAAYKGVSSVEVEASTETAFRATSDKYNGKINVTGFGGNPTAIDPSNTDSLTNFIASCTDETSYGIYESVEFADIAPTEAGNWLRKYINLAILEFSLNNPIIFSNSTLDSGSVTTSVIADDGYKVISGGGACILGGIISSGPVLDSGKATGWEMKAMAASILGPMPVTCFAIAVLDPGDLLITEINDVQLTGKGQNNYETLSAGVVSGRAPVLVGGGVSSSDGIACIIASYPDINNNLWNGAFANPDFSQTRTFTVSSICIGCDDITITLNDTDAPGTINSDCTATIQKNIISGGVLNEPLPPAEILGSAVPQTQLIMHSSYPSSSRSWTGSGAKIIALGIDAEINS